MRQDSYNQVKKLKQIWDLHIHTVDDIEYYVLTSKSQATSNIPHQQFKKGKIKRLSNATSHITLTYLPPPQHKHRVHWYKKHRSYTSDTSNRRQYKQHWKQQTRYR